MVRVGEKQADITAEFELTGNTAARAWLATQAEPDADNVVLRRVIDVAGKSRAQINGRPASVTEMRELGATLLELHAQHEHQALLRGATQRALLDRYADAEADASAVQAAFRSAALARDTLTHARTAAAAIARERAALETDLVELRAAKPNAAEWDALSQEQSRLSHSSELLEVVEATRATIADDDGVSESVAQLARSLVTAERMDPALSEARQLIESAGVQLDEAAQWLRLYASKSNLDPERLQQRLLEHELDARRVGSHERDERRVRRRLGELGVLRAEHDPGHAARGQWLGDRTAERGAIAVREALLQSQRRGIVLVPRHAGDPAGVELRQRPFDFCRADRGVHFEGLNAVSAR